MTEQTNDMPRGLAVLLALSRRDHVYEGTCPVDEVERRRVKNRAARRARRLNRQAAQR